MRYFILLYLYKLETTLHVKKNNEQKRENSKRDKGRKTLNIEYYDWKVFISWGFGQI